ncbi:hypothetical protein [Paenibacillus sp. MBLB4367]|uniref:hypothetical protein n=1 Tax=Paenibacillus sp. MBLB4367 TaxID=3384767 RepID=UPI003908182E
MNANWHSYPPYQSGNVPAPPNAQQVMQIMISLDSRLDKLIQLMEENNKLLRSIEQQQSRVVSAGGGSVIVRM